MAGTDECLDARSGGMSQINLRIKEVACDLQVHPELRRGVEHASQENGGFGGHIALAIDKCVDPLDGNPHLLCELDLCHFPGEKELLKEDLPRVGWPAFLWDHGSFFSGSL
jgi:hypothetical protein